MSEVEELFRLTLLSVETSILKGLLIALVKMEIRNFRTSIMDYLYPVLGAFCN